MRFLLLGFAALIAGTSAAAQQGASLSELASTPVVTVHIGENLSMPPDQATISVGVQSHAPTAVQALEINKANVAKVIAAIRSSGIAAKAIQTQGVNLNAEYDYGNNPMTRGSPTLKGYAASNTVQVKTQQIDRLSTLLDTVTKAGANQIYGPTFAIADPLPLRKEARKRAMVRGEAEALEYAQNAGFARVRLLSVEEGLSYRTSDIVLTGARQISPMAPPPPPPPAPERDGGIEPGQIETGVQLTLVYRMEK